MKIDRALVTFLKANKEGPEVLEALRKRTQAQLADWRDDPMVARVMSRAKEIKAQNVLDVGCYTGWLYHYLGKPSGYIGIDRWPEAISVAKETFPDGDFRCMDVMDFHEKVEFVWCSQAGFGNRVGELVEHLKTIGKNGVALLLWHEAEKLNEGKLDRSGQLVTIRW